MRQIILAGLIFLNLCGKVEKSVDFEVNINTDNILTDDFLGAGVQVSAYPWFDVSEDDWQKVFSRMDFMKIPFTRIMVDWTTFFAGLDETGEPQYLFEGELMQRVYKLLDYCEQRNVIVMFGQWGWANTALHKEGENWDFAPDSPIHARISCALANQLISVKSYTCIKWFDLINEPDGYWSSCNGDWELWARVADQMHAELVRIGLIDKIKIAGPCDCFRGWIENALTDSSLRQKIDIYNEHKYIWNKNVISGEFEETVKSRVTAIQAKDPGKKYFAGELGFLDGKNKTDQQLNVYDYWYGVSMADAAVQMMRAGASGYLAWYLDDALHWKGDSDGPLEEPADAYEKRKIWGFWNIKGAENGNPQDENLRPWFYSWSLLSRNFPQGCQILEVEKPSPENICVTAARIPDGNKYHLSLTAVNNSEETRRVKIFISGIREKLTFAEYDYCDSDNDNIVDAWTEVVDVKGNDIFPAPSNILRKVKVSKNGLVLELPGKSVVILTTLEYGKPVLIEEVK